MKNQWRVYTIPREFALEWQQRLACDAWEILPTGDPRDNVPGISTSLLDVAGQFRIKVVVAEPSFSPPDSFLAQHHLLMLHLPEKRRERRLKSVLSATEHLEALIIQAGGHPVSMSVSRDRLEDWKPDKG